MRDVDLDAVDKLRKMKGITVLRNPDEIRDIVKKHIENHK
jgi:flavoprotein